MSGLHSGDSDTPNGEPEQDSAEITLSDAEKLALLWRIIQGDPTGELGRKTGIAQLVLETHGMVGEVLRHLREQDVMIAELQRDLHALKKLPEGV